MRLSGGRHAGRYWIFGFCSVEGNASWSGGGEEKPAMDTLPGHFIRYIWQAPGQLIKLLVNTLSSEFGRVLFSEMLFCRFWLLTSVIVVGIPLSQTDRLLPRG